MNSILFIDINLVACDFLKFDWSKMLNCYVDFSFTIFFLRMTCISRNVGKLKMVEMKFELGQTLVFFNLTSMKLYLIAKQPI